MQTFSTRTAFLNSQNGKEIIKEGNLEHRKEERTIGKSKTRLSSINSPYPLELSKLCLMVEARSIALSKVVLNDVCRRN